MVEKAVRVPNADFYKGRSKEVKTHDVNHTRPCSELAIEKNCKLTTEKKLTKNQSISYNQILKDQRDKDERGMRRFRSKKKGSPGPPPKKKVC